MLRDNKGATAIEYGLIAALIAVAAIAGMKQVAAGVNGTFNHAGNVMTAANT